MTAEVPIFSGSSATSVGAPPVPVEPGIGPDAVQGGKNSDASKATLTIERGDAAGASFSITREESVIGRWDADNGIFPDIDLDNVDQEAKVSRRHARIVMRDGKFYLEDLGSTNGTYINRGRRLLPGTPQPLADGDEIIVGKTFLRFHSGN
jgi:pSer/pThr/pTyr-binding forkhead associated (FHA) protein